VLQIKIATAALLYSQFNSYSTRNSAIGDKPRALRV